MIALYCITATGLLLSMQYRAQREFDEQQKIPLHIMEKRLDEENIRLDNEIADLLTEHRRLCRGHCGEE